jgi:hypothetical protein
MRRIGVVLLDYEHYTADSGDFDPSDVEALVLECTVLPQLRPVLRTITSVPLFDAMTYTAAVV